MIFPVCPCIDPLAECSTAVMDVGLIAVLGCPEPMIHSAAASPAIRSV